MLDLLTSDIVEEAKDNIKNLKSKGSLPQSSQLRKFMSAIISLKNKADMELIDKEQRKDLKNEKYLSEKLKNAIKFLKIDFLYQAGRKEAKNVDAFVKETEMDKLIDSIGDSRERFNRFVKYYEALVAYHKYETNEN